MKICMITGSWPPAACGIADAMPILLTRLIRKPGVEAHVITSRGYQNDGAKSLFVHDLIERWNWRAYFPLEKLLEEIRPDIIHIQYSPKEHKKHPFINFLPFLLKRRGFPVIATVHEYKENSLLGKIRLWPTFFGVDLILVPDAEYIPAIKKIDRHAQIEFIQVAPNIPQSKLSAAEKAALRRRYLGESHKLLLGFFGLVDKNKLILPALNALHQLKTKHNVPAKFLIIGKLVENDPTVAEVKNAIVRYGLEEDCIITDYLDSAAVADHLSILDFAIQIYQKGLSPRNASFLAALNQNIKIITTAGDFYSPEYPNVFVTKRDETLADQLCAIVLENMDKQSELPAQNIGETMWETMKEKHFGIYRKFSAEKEAEQSKTR
jgi:hypothetical protein